MQPTLKNGTLGKLTFKIKILTFELKFVSE